MPVVMWLFMGDDRKRGFPAEPKALPPIAGILQVVLVRHHFVLGDWWNEPPVDGFQQSDECYLPP